MVSTKSALEDNDSQQDVVASRSKLGKVFRSGSPPHIPVQQGFNHLGLQLAEGRGGRSSYHTTPGRTVWVCSHETWLSVDLERVVSFFLDNAALV